MLAVLQLLYSCGSQGNGIRQHATAPGIWRKLQVAENVIKPLTLNERKLTTLYTTSEYETTFYGSFAAQHTTRRHAFENEDNKYN